MCLWTSFEKKNMKKYFFGSLKSAKKESDPDPEVRGTDPGTKLSRIPNTGSGDPAIFVIDLQEANKKLI
jgi:hypothetical protein